MKVALFDFPIFELIFYFYVFFKFCKHSKYIYDNLLNSNFWHFDSFTKFENLLIIGIEQVQKYLRFNNFEN